MDEREEFRQWWEENGKRGISFCECSYNKLPLAKIREYVQEFKGVDNPISKHPRIKKEKIVQINDLHIPFHDKKSLELFYRFLDDFKPDQIVIAGDMVDFYLLSKFDKDPLRQHTIQSEIDESYEVLKELTKRCSNIHFIAGNHENRLRKFLWQNPSLASIKVLELPSLLSLDTLGIKYHDYQYIFNGFRFTHGELVRAESGTTAKAELMKYGNSMASGHTHRLGMFLRTDARGTVGAYEGGCMCNLNPEYVKGVPNWQQGFLVYTFRKDRFYCQIVPIIDHKFLYGNKEYK